MYFKYMTKDEKTPDTIDYPRAILFGELLVLFFRHLDRSNTNLSVVCDSPPSKESQTRILIFLNLKFLGLVDAIGGGSKIEGERVTGKNELMKLISWEQHPMLQM